MTIAETRPQATGATTATRAAQPAELPGFAGWLATGDHKRIGRSWIVTSLLFLAVAGVLGAVVNVEQLQDGVQLGDAAETVTQVADVHGLTAVFLFVVPMAVGLATFVVPLQVGAANVAFPRGSATAYWTYLISGILLVTGYAVGGGPGGDSATGTDLWLLGLVGVNLALIVGLISVVTTVVALRAPGMTLGRVPFFSWATFAAGGLILLSSAVLIGNLIVAFVAHHYGGIAPENAQSWAWYFSIPGAFLLAVPGLGAAADVVPVFARVRQQNPGVVFGLLGALAVIGFGAWAQAPDTFDEPLYIAMGVLAVLPALGLVAGWADTLRRGNVRFGPPLAFALGAGLLLLAGALAAVAAVIEPLDLAGTAWISAQVHLTLLGAATLGLLGGLFYWAPKMWGTRLSDGAGLLAFAAVFLGSVLLALPELIAGLVEDAPMSGSSLGDGGSSGLLGGISAAGGLLTVLGVLVVLAAVVGNGVRHRGAAAGDDPWEGHTLEWSTTSPPPPGNFTAPVGEVTSDRPLLDAREASA